MNSLQTLGKWFYTGLIMTQILALVWYFAFPYITILTVDISMLEWYWIISPSLIYASVWYLSGFSESLSNILKVILRWTLIVGFLYLIYYILTL